MAYMCKTSSCKGLKREDTDGIYSHNLLPEELEVYVATVELYIKSQAT